jgi:hypothetical protein
MPRGLSDYDSAVIQGRLWTPEVLPWLSWHDFSDLSTVGADGSGINIIRDKSGNGRDFSQSTNAYKPAPQEQPTGKWAGNFTASGGKVLASASNWATGVKTIVCCYRSSGIPASGLATVCSYRDTSVSRFADFGLINPAVLPGYQPRTFGDGIQINPTTLVMRGIADATTTNPEIFIWTFDGVSNTANSSYQARLNGQARTVVASDVFARQAGTNLSSIGARADSTSAPIQSFDFLGEQYEHAVIGSVLSLGDLQRVEGYLSWKWGIRLAADHPYANRPPLIGD